MRSSQLRRLAAHFAVGGVGVLGPGLQQLAATRLPVLLPVIEAQRERQESVVRAILGTNLRLQTYRFPASQKSIG